MEANQIAHQMSSFLNTFSAKNKEFCEIMAQDHKTLQQRFTALCFEWIKHCSTDEYGQSTDGRNEDTHRVCKMIVEQFGDKLYVPYI
jgi:hypothetical protein